MRIEDVFGVLHKVISTTYIERLRDFVDQNAAPNWVIASDYVIGAKERYRNAFCYTIYPLNAELESTLTEIRQAIPQDLKDTSLISDTVAECLRSTRRFSFCFVTRQGHGFLLTPPTSEPVSMQPLRSSEHAQIGTSKPPP
jgi:hypothetical protein